MRCPKCKSESGHRSRTRSRWDEWRKIVTGKRPYRCGACGVRWWAPEEAPTFVDVAYDDAESSALKPLDLEGLDRGLEPPTNAAADDRSRSR